MAFTYNFTSSPLISWVRMLIWDKDATNPIYSDEEINQFIYLTSAQALYVSSQAAPNGAALQNPPVPQVYSIYQAASMALLALTANQAGVLIKRLLDVELDTKTAMQGFRDLAKSYRETEDRMGQFAIAEWVVNEASARERIDNQLMRLYGG